MFVDNVGNFIFNIKKTFQEIQNYKENNKNKNSNKSNNIDEKINDNPLNNSNYNLFSEEEIHLIDSLKQDYHIKIFTCYSKKQNDNNYSTDWNQLITLTLKNSETEQKIEHLERWLLHFL